MIKLILKLCFICSFVFFGTTQAALINVTQEEYYITVNNYNNSGIDIDIAWASSVNTERYYSIGNGAFEINTLYAPEQFHTGNTENDVIDEGWHFAEENALSSSLLASFTSFDSGSLLASFTTTPETYINAFQYWNSDLIDVNGNISEIEQNQVASEWVWNIGGDDDNVTPPSGTSKPDWNSMPETWDVGEQFAQKDRIDGTYFINFETFYFRVNDPQTGNATPVPEPSTLMIFALGLIALASKKRLFS
jgi:hypothetical protein